MADIFLSYSQQDRERAQQVADALTASGWKVWWDPHLSVAADFRKEIERQLHAAKCVVVLWSEASIDSLFVRDEADEGRSRGALVQALIHNVKPPLGFRSSQWANLTDWTGDIQSPEFLRLRSGVIQATGGATSGKTKRSTRAQQIRYWIEKFPEVSDEDAQKLFNNAIASWRAVVATPIVKVRTAADANVIVHTETTREPAVAEVGPPRKGHTPLGIWFGSDVKWTARTFEAASCRMLGHVLGLYYTDMPGQLMTQAIELNSIPLTPQEDDIRRIRAVWPD